MKNMLLKAVCLRMAGPVSLCLVVGGLLLVSAGHAFADDFIWINASGGSFGDVANWEVGGSSAPVIPSSGDKIVNFTTGGYRVALDQDTTVDSVLVNIAYVNDDTTVTLDMGGHTLDAVTGFSVIDVRMGKAKLILTNGTLRCNTAHILTKLTGISVAYATGNNRSGRLAVIGPETQVQGEGNLVVAGVESEFEVLMGAQVQMSGSLWLHQKDVFVRISGNGTFVGLGGQLTFDDYGSTTQIENGAALIAQGISMGYASNLTLRVDNATVTLTNKVFDIGYRCANSLVVVSNNAVVSAAKGVQMSGNVTAPSVNGKLIVADGGSVLVPSGQTISIGRDYSRNARMELNNGQVETGYVEVGGYSSPVGACSNSLLRISGTESRLKATSVLTYGTRHGMLFRYGARMEIVVPQDGFAQTPIQLTQGSLVTARSEISGYEDVPNTLFVDADAWAKAHPGETITLISCGRESAAGFAELIANATLPTSNPDRLCTLSVTADNKSLLLTAPRERGTVLCIK